MRGLRLRVARSGRRGGQLLLSFGDLHVEIREICARLRQRVLCLSNGLLQLGLLGFQHLDRVPGLGQVDWLRLVDTLYEGGFDGVLSVEHEDPVWGGDEDRIRTGLQVAYRTLRPLLVA